MGNSQSGVIDDMSVTTSVEVSDNNSWRTTTTADNSGYLSVTHDQKITDTTMASVSVDTNSTFSGTVNQQINDNISTGVKADTLGNIDGTVNYTDNSNWNAHATVSNSGRYTTGVTYNK